MFVFYNVVFSIIRNKSKNIEKRPISNSSSDLENIDYIRNNSVESYTTGIIDDINNHLIHSHSILLYIIYIE